MIQIQPRDLEILYWVLHMKFVSLEDLAHVFFKGSNPHRAPYRRLLKLVKEGLLAPRRIYREPKEFYVATHKTVRYLRDRKLNYVPALCKKESFFNHYEHDKRLIKLRIFARELKLGLWIPERMIRSMKPRGVCPDAVLYNSDAQYTVEYEWNEKDKSRYEKIFDRYEDKEHYTGALYILPTQARIEKLWKKIDCISKKIYFISEEALYCKREKAIFRSKSGSLTVEHLIQHSLAEARLDDLKREDLKKLVSEDPREWEKRKPYIPIPKDTPRDEDELDTQSDDDSKSYPPMYPAMYPGERSDEPEENF